MILSFKKQFVDPIKNGTKIHSIREDKHGRWKAGRKIHGATGVRTKNYNCFFEEVCKSTQNFEIVYDEDLVFIFINNVIAHQDQIEQLAKNDGFDSLEEFFKWFNGDFKGKIIHWTDFKY